MKHRKPPPAKPKRSQQPPSPEPVASLPQDAHLRLVALFDAGRYVELESRARILAEQHPDSGLAWKILGVSLLVQGKDGIHALQKAGALLPGDADTHYNLGNALNALGRLDDAIASYRRALQIQPGYANAHCNLGNIQLSLGRLDDAVASYRRALEIQADFTLAHSNLGNVLNLLGRFDEAAASCRRALTIAPDYAEAHNNLGSALHNLGQIDDATASYRRALALQPDFAKAHYNLGVALSDLGCRADAAASFRRTLEIEPNLVAAHSSLGNALYALGQFDAAVASYCRALAIEPDYTPAHSNLGNALKELGRFEEAVASYRRALAIEPNFADAHGNLGIVLKNLGRLDEAVASYRRALEIKPDFAEAHSNLGNALKDLGRLDDAVASYRRALTIRPDYAGALSNLGSALNDLGRPLDAVASYRRALALKPDYAEAHSNLLLTHNYLPDSLPETLLSEARHYGALVARQARPYTDWPNVPDAERRLRVGIVSGDLHAHPVGYFVEGLLAALASGVAGRLELFAYPSHSCADDLTERIKACCCGWHSAVGVSDERLAAQIRADGIDILIDLAGHTAHNRLPLFAWKPAPVQASWLGYFATTGVTEIDYLIADPLTLPESEEIYFTEKIWRLPETRLCFTPPDVAVPVSALPAMINGYITFGCFNNLTKMNDAVVALWAQVLRAVAGSRLLLKARQLDTASVRQNTLARFAAEGIAADRLILEGPSPRVQYLATYGRVDIALDPFPFTGGTTSAESLWMGVPVLTLAGERFLSRQGLGLVTNAGLPDWVAADYVARAAWHAGDIQRLAALRASLRQQVLAAPIFDAARFARHFEAALRGMWARWCSLQD